MDKTKGRQIISLYTEAMEIIGDFSTSVRKALKELDPKYENYGGLVVCGTHTPHDTETMIEKIRNARLTGRPTLLLCFGYQLGAIEYARNILGIADATSEEFGKGTFVVKKRKDLNIGHKGDLTYWNNFEVAIDWPEPWNFVATQGHPEYESSFWKPHPLLTKFIKLCAQSS